MAVRIEGCDFERNNGRGRHWPRIVQAFWMKVLLGLGRAQRWANDRVLAANDRRWRA